MEILKESSIYKKFNNLIYKHTMSLDEFINKIGSDKVTHFFAGCSICSLVSFVAILQEHELSYAAIMALPIIGTLVAAFVGAAKEVIDKKFDPKDLLATVLGCIPVFISVAIGVWFNYLSA